jgi:glucose/arabinose dehydrogenase
MELPMTRPLLLPVAAPGTAVARFSQGLDHPCRIFVLPNGDVLVAETKAPPRPESGKGIKGWIMEVVMGRAGACVPGAHLYVTVGSKGNVAENGIDKEEGRAAIWELDLATGTKRLFASGLRNPNGMAWEPESGASWTSVNERDELGSGAGPSRQALPASCWSAARRATMALARARCPRRSACWSCAARSSSGPPSSPMCWT